MTGPVGDPRRTATSTAGTAASPLLNTGTVSVFARPASRSNGDTNPGDTSTAPPASLRMSSVTTPSPASSALSNPSPTLGRTFVNAQPVGFSVQCDHVSPAPRLSYTASAPANAILPV